MVCNNCGNALNGQEKSCPMCGSIVNNVNKNNEDKQKLIIIILLSIVVVLLAIAAFLIVKSDDSSNNNKKKVIESRTFMIYMIGSNLETDHGIASADLAAIDPDLIDLENVNILLYTGGTKRWHNFISNEENAIYQLKEDGFEKIKTYDKKNMGGT